MSDLSVMAPAQHELSGAGFALPNQELPVCVQQFVTLNIKRWLKTTDDKDLDFKLTRNLTSGSCLYNSFSYKIYYKTAYKDYI